MVPISKSAVVAYSCLLTAILAQTPGSTETLPIPDDPSLALAITWGSNPVDSYNVYAGATYQAQMNVGRTPANQSLPTDWCYTSNRADGQGITQGCAHLNIQSQSAVNGISKNQLEEVVTFIRGLGADFSDPSGVTKYGWNYEAVFDVVYNKGVIASGFVANQTDANVPVGRPDIQPGKVTARSFVA